MAGALTAAIAAAFAGSAAPSSDPYFEYTTLLLPGNGTNGAQNNTFLDGSTNNFTITRNGNTTQGTFSPFSQTGWGNYFDGSGDYLSVASNTAFDFGTGDFTIELWINLSAAANYGGVLTKGNVGAISSATWAIDFNNTGTALNFYVGAIGSGAYIITTTTNVRTLNAWTHVAVSRISGSTKMFINGVQEGSTYSTSYNVTSGGDLYVGTGFYTPSTNFVTGYISNVRILKGTGLYSSAFTPPTAPLTAITNTSLLTCQSNRFIDNSSNNFTITVNGNTSVVAFSPFNPSASWSAATYGGSGYFDGSGDYLTAPDNAAFQLGTNSFCIEGWFFPTTTGDGALISKWATTAANAAWNIVRISGTLYCQLAYGSSAINATTTDWPLNQWSHIAFVRNGSTLSAYLNGTRFYTNASFSNTINVGVNGVTVGTQSGGTSYPFTGYLSGFRVVNGSAVYDPTSSTITVPTSPLTAITNTSLLLNFTNAGIYDATSKNDLETVGNAQISTAISAKWGSGSMYFDGTGDYLQQPLTNLLSFAENTYTIEAWIYPTTSSGYRRIFSTSTSAAANVGYLALVVNGTSLVGETRPTNGGAVTTISGGTVNANTWYHAALSVNNGSARLFLDGVQIGSTTSFSALATMNYVTVGALLYNSGASTTDFFTGYIQDLRITKGYARYTANFTPPTAAFPTL